MNNNQWPPNERTWSPKFTIKQILVCTSTLGIPELAYLLFKPSNLSLHFSFLFLPLFSHF